MPHAIFVTVAVAPISPILIVAVAPHASSIPPVFIVIVPLVMPPHHVMMISPILIVVISHMTPRHGMSVSP
jgi:hypothetical protein